MREPDFVTCDQPRRRLAWAHTQFNQRRCYPLNLDNMYAKFQYELWHKISKNVVCATSKASDQPAHTHILIRAFASHLNIL